MVEPLWKSISPVVFLRIGAWNQGVARARWRRDFR